MGPPVRKRKAKVNADEYQKMTILSHVLDNTVELYGSWNPGRPKVETLEAWKMVVNVCHGAGLPVRDSAHIKELIKNWRMNLGEKIRNINRGTGYGRTVSLNASELLLQEIFSNSDLPEALRIPVLDVGINVLS